MNGTIFIAMIMLGVIGFVVLLFAVQSRRMNDKKKNEMLQVYNSLVTKSDLDIIEEDKLANRILAIDPIMKVFVLVDKCRIARQQLKIVMKPYPQIIVD